MFLPMVCVFHEEAVVVVAVVLRVTENSVFPDSFESRKGSRWPTWLDVFDSFGLLQTRSFNPQCLVYWFASYIYFLYSFFL